MFINDFKEITFDKFLEYKKCTGYYNNSESSIATMYMWQHYANVKYSTYNDILFSLYKDNTGSYSSFMPYGKNRNTHECISIIFDLYESLNSKPKIKLCTDDFVDFLLSSNKYKMNITPVRNSYDYVYRTQDLINLSGKKYHSKKNHVNSFNKKYSYKYLQYVPTLYDPCIEFCKKILKKYYNDNDKAYKTELLSIEKTLRNICNLNLKCGLITIDDKIIALSIGERLNKEYALIHVEKADYNYRTAYSVINNLFLKNEFSDTVYVNREEDMGIDGLRKAKESYHPCHMIKKYNVEFD